MVCDDTRGFALIVQQEESAWQMLAFFLNLMLNYQCGLSLPIFIVTARYLNAHYERNVLLAMMPITFARLPSYLRAVLQTAHAFAVGCHHRPGFLADGRGPRAIVLYHPAWHQQFVKNWVWANHERVSKPIIVNAELCKPLAFAVCHHHLAEDIRDGVKS